MHFLTLLTSTVLLLPSNLLILAALGLLCRHHRPGAIWLTWGALALLLILSTRAGALLLAIPLENQNPPLITLPPSAQAIIVLGGSVRSNTPEYDNNDAPSYPTLARLQYAAHLQRTSGLPILASGGKPDGSAAESEAAVMARSLHQDFGITTQWLETQSTTTAQNAVDSAAILRRTGIQHIVLVTDAIHMPRALASFRYAAPELTVTAAPTVFFSAERRSSQDFLPSGEGLRCANYALHEWIGMFWYKIQQIW